MSFVSEYGLWNAAQRAAAKHLLAEVKARKIQAIRFSFADQHGILRGKTIAARALKSALESGVAIGSTMLLKDTSHKTVFPAFTPGGGIGMPEMEGSADFLILADPATFRVLPWAPETAWVLCDLYFADGKPVPFDTRRLLREALARLGMAGYEFLAGLEIEFHVFRIIDPHLRPEDAGGIGQPGTPPEVSLLTTGYQLLTEQRYDQIDPVIELLRKNLEPLGLPLRSFEVEFGPSQIEITLEAMRGMASADAMLLFRSAVKQVARRHGYHATFMCRPRLPNVMSSGWHLHQSLSKNGKNAFVSKTEHLSEPGKQYLAGLLEHAGASCAFSTPTINGYKRYRPYSLAPERVIWGRDNRGAMLRVMGGAGDSATRIENRIGEPGANPYLYFASQIHCGLDGLSRKLPLPPPSRNPYEDKAQMLPRSLGEALEHLKASRLLRESMGSGFVDYYCRIKEAEIERCKLSSRDVDGREVSEWEHREYFDLL
ncbi:MAG TPA: glutamine synthetase family protein [Burkholderiales bacterium]|nr:glutamine synthetase family protein [Burkholderiales bacterium]HEX2651296.1 glutamine synthetase family protein [Burkholderiales bacterium]